MSKLDSDHKLPFMS